MTPVEQETHAAYRTEADAEGQPVEMTVVIQRVSHRSLRKSFADSESI